MNEDHAVERVAIDDCPPSVLAQFVWYHDDRPLFNLCFGRVLDRSEKGSCVVAGGAI